VCGPLFYFFTKLSLLNILYPVSLPIALVCPSANFWLKAAILTDIIEVPEISNQNGKKEKVEMEMEMEVELVKFEILYISFLLTSLFALDLFAKEIEHVQLIVRPNSFV